MTTKQLILNEIKKVPEPLLEELLDFIRFLEMKSLEKKMDTAIASESALRKDWSKTEEGHAWLNL